ncbi:MAG: alpha/beta fold hydrolase [Candidatus Krumholzibacteria bacterium]|nr:alpha/beta fold hydrolase [Candidatus Krumholzibacteria bacterium]
MERATREIEIRTRGRRPIRADLRTLAPRRRRAVIIACHGFLGHKRWGFFPYLSERLAEAGFHVLTMSFSMNGIDEETGLFARPEEFAANTVSTELEDLRGVCAFVRSGALAAEGAPGEQLGLFGHSRGGAAAILVSRGLDDVRSLVTWSTVARLDRYTARRKAAWKSEGSLVFTDARASAPLALDYAYYEDIDTHRDEFDLPKAAAALAAPHLMVHGDRDAAVTLSETQALVSAGRGEAARLEIIHGAGHTFNVSHPMRRPTAALERATRLTTEWFTRTLESNMEDRS